MCRRLHRFQSPCPRFFASHFPATGKKYAAAEAAELEKVQAAAVAAETEASNLKEKALADAQKLLDDAKHKEEELTKKIADMKTEQAERVVARKKANEEYQKVADVDWLCIYRNCFMQLPENRTNQY